MRGKAGKMPMKTVKLPAGDGREGKEQESTGCAASGGG